jgi:hypothetical protein
VEQLVPYWMEPGEAVGNDVDLGDHMVTLSGPNMCGKSTFLRALTALVLLANCGLPVPASPGAIVPEVSSHLSPTVEECPVAWKGHTSSIRRILMMRLVQLGLSTPSLLSTCICEKVPLQVAVCVTKHWYEKLTCCR